MVPSVFRTLLSTAMLFALLPVAGAAETQTASEVPDGFVALFNGKDLTGWKGLGHVDPAKYRALSPEARKKLDAENLIEFKKHWRAENGELVNNGQGPYATTVKDYGDFELWIEYKTVPKA
ncbi:MAG: DUF1080 domain-containing protein, partial [Pirellulales bacterium]|nr:DUF1080 domain-containing protein [Pirellulales bacterium]